MPENDFPAKRLAGSTDEFRLHPGRPALAACRYGVGYG